MPPRVFWELLQSLHDSPLTNELNKIDVPTLVIGGKRDILCPPSTQQILAGKIHHCHYVLLEDAGHAPQSDCPHEVAREIHLLFKNLGLIRRAA